MANPTTEQVGKLGGYETTFITRPDLTEEGLKALQERLNGVIASFHGEIVLTEDWGRRKLAYPIQKESRGQYSFLVYTGKGDVVHEMERNLRMHDHVLRFLSVNLEKEFDIEVYRKRRAEIHAASKRREEEREARREERNAERRGYDDRGDDHRRHSPVEEAEDVSGGDSAEE